MNVCKIDLSNLPKNWHKVTSNSQEDSKILKSNDPSVDGTALTENSEIKYRRKRIVSNVKPYKRTYKIQELLNYCKFRVGEIPTCEKPPKMVTNVLADYKYNRLDRIPQGYLDAINLHKELVDKAINLDLRSNNKGSSTKKVRATSSMKSFNISGITITTKAKPDQTIKCAKEFIEWLDLQMVAVPWTIENHNKYIKILRMYMLNPKNKAITPVYKQILKQNSWILDNYQFEKVGKKYILSKKTVKTAKQTIKQVDKPVILKKIKKQTIKQSNRKAIELIKDTSKCQNTLKGKERFKNWLDSWLGLTENKRIWNQNYAAGLNHFILVGIEEKDSVYPESIRLALHEKPYIDMLANKEIKVNMTEQYISLNNTIFKASSISEKPIITEVNQQKDKALIDSFISQLKALGVKEFSIKF